MLEATYYYRDSSGRMAYRVQRKVNPNDPTDKKFTQARPDHNGGWLHNLDGVERVLYRLPELLGADPAEIVFICEGEKCVDELRNKLNLVATCNSGGAGKWGVKGGPSYNEALRGHQVVILSDSDLVNAKTGKRTGTQHAQDVAAKLGALPKSI